MKKSFGSLSFFEADQMCLQAYPYLMSVGVDRSARWHIHKHAVYSFEKYLHFELFGQIRKNLLCNSRTYPTMCTIPPFNLILSFHLD
jgi:hypothetical protein